MEAREGLGDDFAIEEFPATGDGYDVVWRRVPGAPTVILLHELAGVSEKNLRVASRFADEGFSVAMPILLPPPRQSGVGNLIRNGRRVCVSNEFRALAHFEDRPLTRWIRSLAADIARRTERRVGIVGMCLTGNFALAAAVDPTIDAAVACQPSVPPSVGSWSRDLAMSSQEFDALADRADGGFCVRVLRFKSDVISRGNRAAFIRSAIPNADVVEIPSRNPFHHSVLTKGLDAPERSALDDAMTETFDYLRQRLTVSSIPDAM